jgi:hypothetical protein
MQKLSGLVLDRYDDPEGAVLSGLPDGGSSLEPLVKRAHVFTYQELGCLPDETFALILEDGETVMKKFSMADLGNTALSVVYFLENGHKLPVEAQKVAAANLIRGCGWYGIPVSDELQKVAFGAMTLLNTALVAPGAAREVKNNLNAVKGAGPGIMTPEQIKARRLQMGV